MTTQSTPRTPTLANVLDTAIEHHLSQMGVAIPGQITEWDPLTQKAAVKPLVKRKLAYDDGSEGVEALPVVTGVPVLFPRSAGFFVSFPLAVGDFVLLVFCDRSIDRWLSGSGTDTDPDDFRMHDLSDAIAIPGPAPFARAIKQVDTVNMVMGADNGGLQIHITPSGTMQVKVAGTAESFVALGDVLQTWWTSTMKVWLDAHVHPTGVGPSGVATVASPAFDATIVSAVMGIKGP